MDSTTATVSAIPIRAIIEAVRTATAEECCELLTALNKGMALFNAQQAATEDEPAASPPRAAKKPRATKKAAPAPAPLPTAGAPDASYYRIAPEDVDNTVCCARIFQDSRKDTRWSIAVYWDTQCGKPLMDGEDLCATCYKRLKDYAANPKPGRWNGTLYEEPLGWSHTLGSAWATYNLGNGKLKWLGGGAATGGASAKHSATVAACVSAADAMMESGEGRLELVDGEMYVLSADGRAYNMRGVYVGRYDPEDTDHEPVIDRDAPEHPADE